MNTYNEIQDNINHNKRVYNGTLGDNYDSIIRFTNYRKQKHEKHFKEIQNYSNNIQAIVDLGCGTGEFTLMLYDVFPKAIIYAVDVSENVLNIFKDKLTLKQLERTIIVNSDMENFLNNYHYFDLIVMSGSLHHTIRWKNILNLISQKTNVLYLALEPQKIKYRKIKRFIYYSLGIIDNNVFIDKLRHSTIDGADANIGGGFCIDEIRKILKEFNIKLYDGIDARYIIFYFIKKVLGINKHFSMIAYKNKKVKE